MNIIKRTKRAFMNDARVKPKEPKITVIENNNTSVKILVDNVYEIKVNIQKDGTLGLNICK